MRSEEIPTILIATGNAGKVRELGELFRDAPAVFQSLADLPQVRDVEETGSTFTENALLKAAGYAKQTGLWSLADDSGLAVDALGGGPGVLSARYGGGSLGFDKKIALVLSEMERSSDKQRSARFICSMVLADENGRVLTAAEGICEGMIAARPAGSGGFGYDPIFVPDGYNKTFGELDDAIKSKISHRARAAAKIMRYLLGFKAV